MKQIGWYWTERAAYEIADTSANYWVEAYQDGFCLMEIL